MRKDLVDFFEKCHQIHLVLLRVLCEQIGLDGQTLSPSVQAKDHFVSLVYYPETTVDSFKERARAKAHTDYGTLTLLFNDSAGGLQVRHRNGAYFDAPPVPGCCIVNVGDLLSRWFNGQLKSTEHRVVEPPRKPDAKDADNGTIPARYSIAFFGQPNRDAWVEPLAPCITAAEPKKYNGVFALKHVQERLAALHKSGHSIDNWTDDMQRKGTTAVSGVSGGVEVK